jgi:hypothetical protein
VEALKGVNNVTINPLTGSVLLEYDPETIPVERLAEILEPFDPEGAATLRNPELLKPRSLFAKPVAVPLDYLKAEDRPAVRARRQQLRPRGSAEATSETINLTVGFLGVVFSAFWGSIRTHTLLGASFGVMLGQHIWKHRHRLRPIQQMSWLEILGLDVPSFLRPKAHDYGPETDESYYDEYDGPDGPNNPNNPNNPDGPDGSNGSGEAPAAGRLEAGDPEAEAPGQPVSQTAH